MLPAAPVEAEHVRGALHCATPSCRRELPPKTTGRPRKYCVHCKPPKGQPAPAAGGGPFTLEHFRAWCLKLILDNGQPLVLEEFQERFVADLFAGIPECWLVVPEGNTKTTLLAALGLYHCEHRDEASVPIAASSRDQAQLVYMQAEGFVIRSPWLSVRFKCLEGYRRIKCLANRSRMQVYAADDRTGDGVIPTLALLEELHRHKDFRLYRTWRGKLDKRQGQLATISTAGEPGGEFEETRDRIRQADPDPLRDGAFVRAEAGGVVLHEYAVTDKADIEDMAAVKAANPFSGVTIESLTAKRGSPTMTLDHWCRFTCNLATRGISAAIQEVEWARQTSEDRIPEGAPIWLGLDVGWIWDTTALVPLWIRDPAFRLFGPATVLEPPGDGTSLDPNLIEAALRATHRRNPIVTVVMDTTKAEQLAEWIRTELDAEVVDRTQSNPMAAMDYERFMEGLRMRWLWHCGDVGLTTHALNAVMRELPGEGKRFERPKAARAVNDQLRKRRVIDALTAASMVHTTAAADLMVDDSPKEPAFAWA